MVINIITIIIIIIIIIIISTAINYLLYYYYYYYHVLLIWGLLKMGDRKSHWFSILIALILDDFGVPPF